MKAELSISNVVIGCVLNPTINDSVPMFGLKLMQLVAFHIILMIYFFTLMVEQIKSLKRPSICRTYLSYNVVVGIVFASNYKFEHKYMFVILIFIQLG